MSDISRSLVPQYRQMIAAGTDFPGRSILPQAWIVKQLIRKNGAQTLLDYGCGEAMAYSKEEVQIWWGVMPTLFDPAVERFSVKPEGVFDGVICADVLEHIPEEELPALLAEVRGYAKKFCFFSVCCRPAGKTLPDGRNVHVTIRPEEWWRELIGQFADGITMRIEFTP